MVHLGEGTTKSSLCVSVGKFVTALHHSLSHLSSQENEKGTPLHLSFNISFHIQYVGVTDTVHIDFDTMEQSLFNSWEKWTEKSLCLQEIKMKHIPHVYFSEKRSPPGLKGIKKSKKCKLLLPSIFSRQKIPQHFLVGFWNVGGLPLPLFPVNWNGTFN